MYDLIIVGSGPAGLAGALRARERGLDFVMLERAALANTVYSYPIGDVLFSTSGEVEIDSGSLPTDRKPTREELLEHYRQLVMRAKIDVRFGEEAQSLTHVDDHLLVHTTGREFRSRAVLAAIGGFGRRRLLNVPAQDESRVSYRFIEAHGFAFKQVLVIGGGNSAAEAALFLAKVGADVTLAIRRADIRRAVEAQNNGELFNPRAAIKPWVLDPLETAAREGKIRILTSSEVLEVTSNSAIIQSRHEGVSTTFDLKCDHIFALIGADPETALLESAGARIADDGRPVYSEETFETTIPGLFVAGHITREVHIKNAIRAARRAVDCVAMRLEERAACGA